MVLLYRFSGELSTGQGREIREERKGKRDKEGKESTNYANKYEILKKNGSLFVILRAIC